MIKDFLADTDAFDMPITREAVRPVERAREARGISIRQWVLGFAGLAALLRVGYLMIGTTDSRFVAWYIDSFHHWQISYLTKEIGLGQGRLWDLGGMEYFWGAIPALLGALAMALTFSSDLWPMQLMNIVAGSASVGVLYLVGRRYWGHWAGIALAAFFAVSPVSVLTDASVMQEPVAFLFLVLALYFFLERPLLAGALLGLAASSRPDYWLYSGAILATGLIALRSRGGVTAGFRTALPYALGYALGIGPYVLHLWAQTGNPVYSLYWNFLGNVRGEWMPEVEPTVRQLQAQAVARGLLAIGIAGLTITAWRRPSGWPVIAAGLWGLFLIGYVLGISKYILGYLDRFWFDRIMLLPYLVIAVAVAVGVARLARIPRFGPALASLLLAATVIGLSSLWVPIQGHASKTDGYREDLTFGASVARVAHEGRILVPGDAVVVTYSMVQSGVEARQLLSQNYHPAYSPEDPAAYFQWLRDMDVRWILVRPADTFYQSLVQGEPEHFRLVERGVLHVYAVTP